MKIYVAPKDGSLKEKTFAWIKNRITDAKDIWENNKAEIVILAPVVIGAITAGVKTIGKQANLNKQEQIKEKYIYDTSMGHYWSLKRKLNNSEWLEIERRRRNGEVLGDILDSMRVLK